MRHSILIVGLVLVLAIPAGARMNPYIAGIPVAAAASRTAIATMTFEGAGCTDGSEWDAGTCGWTQSGIDGVFLVDDNDTIAPHGGARQGLIVNDVGDQYMYYPVTTAGTGYITLDYYIYVDDPGSLTAAINNIRVALCDASGNVIVDSYIWSDAGMGSYDNTTYRSWGTTCSDDTWYHIEIEVNLDASTGADAYTVWVDGVEITANSAPYNTVGNLDPDDIARLYVRSGDAASATNAWIDDIYVYEGARP